MHLKPKKPPNSTSVSILSQQSFIAPLLHRNPNQNISPTMPYHHACSDDGDTKFLRCCVKRPFVQEAQSPFRPDLIRLRDISKLIH